MIFLDTDQEYLLASSRSELVSALIHKLGDHPDDGTLIRLAAAVFDVEPLDVVVLEQDDYL